jgi:hypothetical protein
MKKSRSDRMNRICRMDVKKAESFPADCADLRRYVIMRD